MAITLADAAKNTQDDVQLNTIDEFRKSDFILDTIQFDDVVNPAGGGATLTYGYTRLVQERGADFRAFNTENASGEAKRDRYTTELSPIGAAYTIDRALAKLGPAASDELALQSQQAIKAVRARFADAVINGVRDTTPGAEKGFDGLDVALTGSTTEVSPDTVVDWSATALTDQSGYNDALDQLDELLSLLDGAPGAIFGNSKAIMRIKSLARRAGYYAESRTEFGRKVESYDGIPFVDLGAKAGSNNPVIPVETRTVNSVSEPGLSDLYVVRFGLDGFHAVSPVGSAIINNWLPDFSTSGAVKTGEVEMDPVSVVLKATKAAAVLRNVRA